MKKLLLLASVTAMAVSMPATAKPDKGGKGGGGNPAASMAKPQKGNGNAVRTQRAQPSKGQKVSFARGPQGVAGAQKRQAKAVQRSAKQQNKAERRFKAQSRQIERVQRARFEDRVRSDRWVDNRVYVDGRGACPPGLARKNNGCQPPGQENKIFARGERLPMQWYQKYNVPSDYRSLYYDTPDYYYRYDDSGYIYRVNRQSNLVNGLIPLLGGGFSVGQMLPAGYDIYNVPIQYRSSYYDTPDAYYRYGDNAIYQVDPQTQMIESVVALLAGDSLGVGQMLPTGYDTYNLPYDYRDQYYDNDEYLYRYADGNIYQVDAQTQIIQAIISALV